jgi:hypothetical protein
MRRLLLAVVAAIALTLTLALALPTGAGARTVWQCEVPIPGGGTETVDFVSAGDRAFHGISTANYGPGQAGEVFGTQFGEECIVISAN